MEASRQVRVEATRGRWRAGQLTVGTVADMRHYQAALTAGAALVSIAACTGTSPSTVSQNRNEPSPLEQVVTWQGFDGTGSYAVDSASLLPSQVLADAQYTEDKTKLAMAAAATSLADPAPLPVDIKTFSGLDPLVTLAAETGVQSLGRLVSSWPQDLPVTLLITDQTPAGSQWLLSEAASLGCSLADPWYPFSPDELPGSFDASTTCPGETRVFILNVSQFAKKDSNAELSRVTLTVGDDLLGLWQEDINSDVLQTEPRWLTQGSQQLPFLLHVASHAPGALPDRIPPECTPDLAMYDFEDIAFNTKVSCPHALGLIAVYLLVEKVGPSRVVDYFTAPGSSADFESRFETFAGETYGAFSERVKLWILSRNKNY